MANALWWRRAHRVLALLVGVQALLWMASGLYMTVVPIDVIHGDHLVRHEPTAVSAFLDLRAPEAIGIRATEALRVKQWLGRPVYEVGTGASARLVDARTGEPLSPPVGPDSAPCSAAPLSGHRFRRLGHLASDGPTGSGRTPWAAVAGPL